jgi:type III secretion system needle length determinant
MLTDIRSLTLDMPEMPVVERGVGENFTHLLQQQLPREVENIDQVIEFKQYYLQVSDASIDPEMVSGKAADASWMDYLAQQQIQVTTDTDPVATIPVELNEALGSPSLATLAADGSSRAVTGEALPAGGNLLPDSGDIGTEALLAKAGSPGPRPDLALASDNPGKVEPESARNPDQQNLTANAVDAGKSGISPNAIAETRDLDAARLLVTEPVPVRLAGVRSMPDVRAESSSIEISQIARGNESVTRTGSQVVEVPASMAGRDESAEGLVKPVITGAERLDSRASVANLPPGVVARDALAESEPLPVATDPRREKRVLEEMASAREIPLTADKPGPSDPGDALRNLATMSRAPAEAVVAEAGGNRGFELPPQPAGNPTPQNITAMPAHNAVTVATSVQTAVQQPLPAQFDTMNLARGGDAAEWGDGLGERIHWMINQKQNTATIRIDPPMLGKLDVHVKIADDATTITIQTQHAQTRDLIETASQRLRDFLQDNGYQNVNVDVSQRQDQQQARSQTASDEPAGQADEFSQESGSTQQLEQSRFLSGEGLLDTFA